MTFDILEPVASLYEMEGSAVFPPSQPSSRAFRHEQLEISDEHSRHPGRLLNSKIRVIQWGSYGNRDEEYLQLKTLTAFLSRTCAKITRTNLRWARQLDSLQTEEYDDSSYDPVGTLHHTDRENRAMASVLSYYATCLHYSSNPNDQLTQSPRASHGFHFPHYNIPDSSLTAELIRLLIDTIVKSLICNAPHPLVEPRRMAPIGPRGNQGGFYDIL